MIALLSRPIKNLYLQNKKKWKIKEIMLKLKATVDETKKTNKIQL